MKQFIKKRSWQELAISTNDQSKRTHTQLV